MTTPATPENAPGPVLLPTPEVVQAQQLLARQQLAVAMDRARTAATQSAAPAAALEASNPQHRRSRWPFASAIAEDAVGQNRAVMLRK
ncbi:hypothetical protein VM57_17330 [Stenotrophomonas maltophilia]|uniref:Uncharacterized protein n=1 Tax=Stenotrophomonas maltophilia TaxID=40324 RepID=A0A0F5ZNK0_STEMA|nr:hypothetical protein VM57_17330 [Stenotrophomonas maltophilia]